MTNNDIIRSLRYTLDLTDTQMIGVFAAAEQTVNREQISNWLKRDEDPSFQECDDTALSIFLNGLINQKRGKREGPQPKPEDYLTNNNVLRKLKIAFNLQSEDLVDIMHTAKFPLSKHEFSAFFRNQNHKHYRSCKDQILRYFLKGLSMKLKPESPKESEPKSED